MSQNTRRELLQMSMGVLAGAAGVGSLSCSNADGNRSVESGSEKRSNEVSAPVLDGSIKITRISTKIVHVVQKNWVFAKVETDQGITGWGEATVEFKPHGVTGSIKDLSSFLIGEDPRRIEHLFQSVYRQSFFRMGIIGMSAWSGIEQACWDIFGKSVQLPVHVLLGGSVRQKVRLYSNIGAGLTAKPLVERALESIEQGYTGIKTVFIPLTEALPHASQVRQVEQVMRTLRNAVGDKIDIMVDFHGRTTPAAAIEYARALEPYQPYFIEEPVLPENVDGMVEVARSIKTPVATGERLVTRFQFRELCEKRAAAILQPDISHCGGILEAKKIASLAETYYMAMAPHNPLSPLTLAASTQFALSTPNFLIQESFRTGAPWANDIFTEPIEVEDGHIPINGRPGLGLEVNEAEADKHPFEPSSLPHRQYHPDGAVADW